MSDASAAFLDGLFGLTGKTAVVIGGTGVLGGAIAEGLAKAGAFVVVAGRGTDRGEARVAAIQAAGGQGTFVSVDVTSRESIEALLASTLHATGQADILVNCAGVNAAEVGFGKRKACRGGRGGEVGHVAHGFDDFAAGRGGAGALSQGAEQVGSVLQAACEQQGEVGQRCEEWGGCREVGRQSLVTAGDGQEVDVAKAVAGMNGPARTAATGRQEPHGTANHDQFWPGRVGDGGGWQR